jgi:hypothetical protein
MFILEWLDYNLTFLSRHSDSLLFLGLVGYVVWENFGQEGHSLRPQPRGSDQRWSGPFLLSDGAWRSDCLPHNQPRSATESIK